MKMQGCGWALALVLFVPAALASTPTWSLSGDRERYTLDGGGDVLSTDGASLALQSRPATTQGNGAGVAVIDATPYRRQRVRLSGEIDTRNVEGVAGVWLRADAATGSVSFANSQRSPVSGSVEAATRQVEIYVPATADRLLVGPLLIGTGRMSVTRLRLERVAARSDDGIPPAEIVNEAVRRVRAHALNADRVDWKQAEAEIGRRVPQLQTPDDAYSVISALLRKLQDGHSGLLPPRELQRSASEGVPSFTPAVEVRGAVGIVSVPAFSGTDAAAGEAFARDLASAIAAQAPVASCGWVVDLRGNDGGNMWPMLSGLYPLLGDATPGYVRDREGRQRVWKMVPPEATVPDLSAVPVVVVTGAKTASSGEAVAVAFRGRPHARSVGQPTYGVSTSNQMYTLPGGAGLNLTTARFVDRTGRAYGEALVPDVAVPEPEAVSHAVAMLADCAR
jgi:carboxyl-terminal processing protease